MLQMLVDRRVDKNEENTSDHNCFFSTICAQIAQELYKIAVDNTVITSNETDEPYYRDFSTFLIQISFSWVVLKEITLPGSVMEKNLIIAGLLDAEMVGGIVTDFLTWKEERFFCNQGNCSVLEKEVYWTDSKTIHLCCRNRRISTYTTNS